VRGAEDKNVFDLSGFEHVVISNVDTRTEAPEFAPFSWSYQDAEALTWEDGDFDFRSCTRVGIIATRRTGR
jgi:hypothetical protein